MTAETAFCTDCGAAVGADWEFCGACGARQPVEVTAVGRAAEESVWAQPGAPGLRPTARTPLAGPSQVPPATTYLLALGCLFVLAGVVYLLATAGFPPGTTTTYEYHADGTTTTSSSPDIVEGVITVALFVIGGIFLRAARAAKPSGR